MGSILCSNSSTRVRSTTPPGSLTKLNVRVIMAAMLLCLCVRPSRADHLRCCSQCSPAESVLHRRRLKHGARTPSVLRSLMEEIDQTEPDTRRRLPVTDDEPNVANGADVKQAPTLAGNSHPDPTEFEQQEDLGKTCSQCKGPEKPGQIYSYISGWYDCPRCN